MRSAARAAGEFVIAGVVTIVVGVSLDTLVTPDTGAQRLGVLALAVLAGYLVGAKWRIVARLVRAADLNLPPSGKSGIEFPPRAIDRCVCGRGEAEDDRGAVLRCPTHGPIEPPTYTFSWLHEDGSVR